MAVRHRRPDVDPSLRRRHVHADLAQGADHEVAAPRVVWFMSVIRSRGPSSAAAPASWTASNRPESMLVLRRQ